MLPQLTVACLSLAVSLTVGLSVVLFIVGVLGGIAGGTLIGYCCWGKAHYRKPHPPPPEGPLYEDVAVTTTQGQELKLEQNVAYGHVTK